MERCNGNSADAKSTEQARNDLERAAAGDAASADRLHRAERANPQAAEEVEQDASDGPGKRRVAR